MPDAQITTEILTNEARMLQQMIIKLDEQLEEIQMSRLKLVTVQGCLLEKLGLNAEQLELPFKECVEAAKGPLPDQIAQEGAN
jgi:hypothetical protein|tara:strand:- start:8206 stop:8454 length:249 start_codon:yes stop_codon:yes gene_type:complete